VFSFNVTAYRTNFDYESLSVRLTVHASRCQFVDVNPSSDVENIGTHEIGVSEKGTFVQESKESIKLTGKISAGVADLGSELADEITQREEQQKETGQKRTRQQILSKVIASALKGVARWELLQTPGRPLIGGFHFLATALVPTDVSEVDFELSVSARLRDWGLYEIVQQHKQKIPR
jgi:hypothetical protein